jgi:pimeloyl-ACP methyl ester carboxylesterase
LRQYPGMKPRPDWLAWQSVEIDGLPVSYGQAGSGPVVVFLHGWGLDHRAYRRALRRLVGAGMHVIAPALPGFGGSAALPKREPSIEGFAAWLDRFLERLGVNEPVILMGHSFGGGVAIVFAHDFPERVRALILVNSIGASAWARRGSARRSMADRPLWDWGIHLSGDALPLRQARRVLPVILSEAIGNFLRDPRSFVAVADLARRADLTGELEELRRRRLPVVVLWGNRDRLVTRHTFEETCALLGDPPNVTIEGGHSWLIADPDAFAEVMSNVVGAVERLAGAGGEEQEQSA